MPEAGKAEEQGEQEEAEACGCVSSRVRGGIARGLAHYAGFASRRPVASLLLGLSFVLASSAGLVVLKFDADESNMYLRGSIAMEADARHLELFPFVPERTASFQLYVAKPGRDLLAPQALLEIGRAIDDVMGIRTAAGDGWPDLCEKSWRGFCEADSVFHHFQQIAPGLGFNATPPAGLGEVEAMAWQLGTFCAAQPDACREVLAPMRGFLWGSPGDGAVVGGGSSSSGGGGSAGADDWQVGSFQVIMYLDPGYTDSSGTKGFESFQTAVLEDVHSPSYALGEDATQTENFNVVCMSRSAVTLESARPSAGEGHLFGIAFTLTLVFVCCSIVAPPAMESRMLLGLSCMLVVVLSLACAAGLSGYVGVPYTAMTTLIIFTLFGVSVDDIIVIVHSYDRLPGERTYESLEEDVQKALHHAGPAITLTSSTSLVAFVCAAFCPIPNITYFCVSAAFGIMAVYVLQFTMFVPLFILHERRRLAGRQCCKLDCHQLAFPGVRGKNMWRMVAVSSVNGGCGLLDKLAKLIAKSHLLQAVIIAAFAAMVGLGSWGVTNASSDADLTSYFIDDSFIKEYYTVRTDQYAARAPFYLVVEHQGEGLLEDERLGAIRSLFDDLAALDCTHEPYEDWFTDFEAYLNASHPADLAAERARLRGDAQAFGAKVAEFLDADTFMLPNGNQVIPWRHKRNIVLEGGKVAVSRLVMNYETDFRSQARYIDNMRRSYDLIYAGGPDGDFEQRRVPHVWGISKMQLAAQRDEKVRMIIYENLGMACAAVAVTVMVMLNPLVGLYVGFLVLALDIFVVALLTLYGNKLDFVAFICLSMTIGLVVDYSTHTAHEYLHHPGGPDEKLYHAISKMGASVLAGGGSTVLGILALAGARSEAFRAFFRVLGTAIFIGTAVGVTVGPVLLSALHRSGRFLMRRLRAKA